MCTYFPKRYDLSEITLDGELWKGIKELNDEYLVSSLGRIYSNNCGRLLTLKPHKTFGYVTLPIGRKVGRKSFRVHRLVAEAFIPNLENKKEVNHKNKDKADNRVENLEWMSGYQNAKHKGGVEDWHSGQSKIAPYIHSVARRKSEAFHKVIIPMLIEMVPFRAM